MYGISQPKYKIVDKHSQNKGSLTTILLSKRTFLNKTEMYTTTNKKQPQIIAKFANTYIEWSSILDSQIQKLRSIKKPMTFLYFFSLLNYYALEVHRFIMPE